LYGSAAPRCGRALTCSRGSPQGFPAQEDKDLLFLPFPQEVSPLHSFYTTKPQIAVALMVALPHSACSQKREMF
jgi:hypothetical protein